MENLEEIFKLEANELIADLENSLVTLEKSPGDKTLVEKIFRIMHTLKGNCNMFGFETMGAFMHSLESIYDLVRNDKLEVADNILDLSLASLDHLKILMDDPALADDDLKAKHQELVDEITAISRGSANAHTGEKKLKENTFYILFRPDENMLKHGVNPLFVLDELAAIGEARITPHTNAIPHLKELDVEKCYVYWDIYLCTTAPKDEIEAAFMFAKNDCQAEIHQVAEGNLLKNKDFVERIDEELSFADDINIDELKEFANNLFQIVKQKKATAQEGAKEHIVSSVRVSSEKLDDLMNLVSELVTTQASLSLLAEKTDHPELAVVSENIEKITRRLRDTAFSVCLVPIENMLTRFQRLIRDLSHELQKEIEFTTEGAETELDKSIIEALADPLLHILRNCIDHGIEDKATRTGLGKPEKGQIRLKAFYTGANVMIQITDDGKGVDAEKIKRTAVKKGLISEHAELTEREAFDLLFAPGFSTAEKVTGVSGRGVGMDVVKRKISDMRGEVWIESEKNKGTQINIKLPLTLSIIDGLLVRIDETHFIIPLSSVHKCYELAFEILQNKFNNLVTIDGKKAPFIDLREEFAIYTQRPENIQLVAVKHEENLVGLCFDEIVGEYQAVLKPLGRLYKQIDIVSGATILGDGTVALVLDVYKIIRYYSEAMKKEETI